MGKETIVFIDLDGVLADFFQGVCKLHDKSPEDVARILTRMKGTYNIPTALGMSSTAFWGAIDSDPHFWEHLHKTPEADEIMETVLMLVDPARIYFLSAPSLDPKSHYGKAKWINQHYPKFRSRLILSNNKHLLAGKGRVLIDDSEKHCKGFTRSVLFPRPWNSKYAESGRALEYFKKEFRRSLKPLSMPIKHIHLTDPHTREPKNV